MTQPTARSFEQPDGSCFSITYEGPILALFRCRGCDYIVALLAQALQPSMWDMRPATLDELLRVFTVVGDGVEHRAVDSQCPNCLVNLVAGYVRMGKL